MFSIFSASNKVEALRGNYKHKYYLNNDNNDINDLSIKKFSNEDFGESKIFELDLSKELKLKYSATSPNLLGRFINIKRRDKLFYRSICSSQILYIIEGNGCIKNEHDDCMFDEGDIVILPYCSDGIKIYSNDEDVKIYSVDDSPLLNYMGVISRNMLLPPIIYKKEELDMKLGELNENECKNSKYLLLGNNITEENGLKSSTYTLSCIYNIINRKSRMNPRRHNYVSIDLCLGKESKIDILLGKDIDENGEIINSNKYSMSEGEVILIPSNYWYSYINDNDNDINMLSMGDVGLYSYQRNVNYEYSELNN